MNNQLQLTICKTRFDFDIAKKLTKDYMAWLGFDLYFQNIDDEFATFDNMYNQPNGCFIYAGYEGKIAGGVGIRKLTDGVCEMKRLYVYDDYRGLKIGLTLCKTVITMAKKMRYQKMRLDTIAKLDKAIKLYQFLGFHKIEKYRENPDETAQFMELLL